MRFSLHGAGAFHGGGPRQPVHAAHEFQELGAAQTVEEQRFLGHQADALLDLQFVPGELEAQDLDAAAIGGNQSGEHADGGRLSSAVGSQEAEERSARDFEIDAVDRGLEAIRFSKIADQDGGGHLY
jgi:hypothetical protein